MHAYTYYVGKPTISPANITVMNHNEQPSFNCTVSYKGPEGITAPNITWVYEVGKEESPLIEGNNYQNEFTSMTEGNNGEFTKTSILSTLNITRLFLATNGSAIVRCKVDGGKAIADAHLHRPEEGMSDNT